MLFELREARFNNLTALRELSLRGRRLQPDAQGLDHGRMRPDLNPPALGSRVQCARTGQSR
jgi:hypothetical protein